MDSYSDHGKVTFWHLLEYPHFCYLPQDFRRQPWRLNHEENSSYLSRQPLTIFCPSFPPSYLPRSQTKSATLSLWLLRNTTCRLISFARRNLRGEITM